MKKAITKSIVFASAALLLTACTTDPYTGESKISNSAKGALIGAIGCAAIGATESGKHARNAAAGCAVVGAGVGLYMDQQEAQLRERLAGSGVGIKRVGDVIELILPSNITFASDRSDLSSSITGTLSDVALVLTEYNKTNIDVVGHTDNQGAYEYNQRLSEDRAKSVSWFLAEQGIAASRLNTVGRSYSEPVATNDTAQGRAANRRVEISITSQ